MRISLNWIRNYVGNLDYSAKDIAEKLSSTLAEIEEIEYRGEGLSNIFVGEIISLEKHPNADKLRVAKVDVKDKILNIVCGAPNISVGQKVPVIIAPGSTVENKIEKSSIRGIESEGMLCSQKELGISDDHSGIFILPSISEVGERLDEILKDQILVIENKALTHRPDCFSHIGIARELAAAFDIKFEDKNTYQLNEQFKNNINLTVESESCKRFCAVELKDVKIDKSPLWLQIRLLYTGIRPVNNVVDITNYIMLDLGQPLHAYDKDLIGDTIIVRDAKENEKLMTLDGKTRDLDKDTLLITNGKRPIGIAGIMGGKDSEINDNSSNIVLESANFDGINVRKTAWNIGLRTDAEMRFEKNLDPNLCSDAIKKATEMIDSLAEASSSNIEDVYPIKTNPKRVKVSLKYIEKVSGIKFSYTQIKDILQRLGIQTENEGNEIQISIPTFRRDLNIPSDIVEEITRMYGYDNLIPDESIISLRIPKVYKGYELEKKIESNLISFGFSFAHTHTFVSRALLEDFNIDLNGKEKLSNPLSEDLMYLKNTLIPTLVYYGKNNLANFDTVDLFEIGTVFTKGEEAKRIGTVSFTKDFYDLKIILENIFLNLKIGKRIYKKDQETVFAHKGKSADILVNDEIIGHIGTIHPSITMKMDIKNEVSFIELYFDKLEKFAKFDNTYKGFSKFQSVVEDINFEISLDEEVGNIIEKIENTNIKEIKEVKIIDIYLKGDTKIVTVRVTLQSDTHTLSENEIFSIRESILK